jgi:predicted DNA repair protein MutK
MVSPESASVSLNGEEVTGVKALITSTVIGAIPGVIFGLIVAGIVKLVTRSKAA